jgi:hypothetical protein
MARKEPATRTPTELRLEAGETVELYPDRLQHRWRVTKAQLQARPDVRVLILLEDARKTKSAQLRAEAVARAEALLASVSPLEGEGYYFAFIQIVAKLDPPKAQLALARFVKAHVKAPLGRPTRPGELESQVPLTTTHHDYRATLLVRAAVLAKASGLDPTAIFPDIEAMLRRAPHPSVFEMGAVLLGLNHAGYDVKPLLRWAFEQVLLEPELNSHNGEKYRESSCVSFAFVSSHLGDREMQEKFTEQTSGAHRKSIQAYVKMAEGKKPGAVWAGIRIFWREFEDEMNLRRTQYIPRWPPSPTD